MCADEAEKGSSKGWERSSKGRTRLRGKEDKAVVGQCRLELMGSANDDEKQHLSFTIIKSI